MDSFGEWVRCYRRRARLTQEELADRSGVSIRTITDLERGRVARPRSATVERLAQALRLARAERAALLAAARELHWGSAADEEREREPVGASARAAALPRALPRAAQPFVGREDDLAVLTATATTAPCLPVVLTGMAGVGKTALAVAFAHRVSTQFPDGQLFIDLHGYDPEGSAVTPQQAVWRALTMIEGADRVSIQNLDEAVVRYRSRLAGSRTLIVLDDAISSQQVRPLLPGDGNCLVIVTSRRRLAGLVARDGARALAVEVLAPSAATRLIGELAGAPGLSTAPETARLAERCGHLPLALRMAAARLGQQAGEARQAEDGPRTVLARLAADDLTVLGVEDDPGVPAALDASYRSLAAPSARALALLGLLPAGRATAMVVAALLGVAPETVRRWIGPLLAVNLLTEPHPGYYRMHDLVQQYARGIAQRLLTEQERRLALARLPTRGACQRAAIDSPSPDGPSAEGASC
ncbi:helix-turn-helix domain-containing protein [Streptantibioticus rubrisoli]|uniref:Helix-turn-helix domain-containing protein n=1 Tax=Streptantibioticus rubrisoli TaxID=1387313 RepID=A0ABT1PBN9_9ACTN|nr:helix-turn-helix domain-containing protein [Streptantibioticus rubrisoli]MCQ4042775.1 helix-turn-helix domain-containing protein [Streptantibioticus rubrisoli]